MVKRFSHMIRWNKYSRCQVTASRFCAGGGHRGLLLCRIWILPWHYVTRQGEDIWFNVITLHQYFTVSFDKLSLKKKVFLEEDSFPKCQSCSGKSWVAKQRFVSVAYRVLYFLIHLITSKIMVLKWSHWSNDKIGLFIQKNFPSVYFLPSAILIARHVIINNRTALTCIELSLHGGEANDK